MRMLSMRISFWRVCSACAPFPGAYAQCTHQFLTRMLFVCISSWRACSACASVPDAHAQSTHQSLTRMLRVYKMNIWKIQKLMRMLRVRIGSWRHTQGAHQSLTQYAKRAHKGRSMRIRNSIYRKVPKTSKNFKNLCWRLQMVSKASGKKIFCPN